MNTPGKNAKLLRILSQKAANEGCTHAAEQIGDCAYQLEVFELVGLKLECQGNNMVEEACNLVSQGASVEECFGDEFKKAPRHSPSDFNISRN